MSLGGTTSDSWTWEQSVQYATRSGYAGSGISSSSRVRNRFASGVEPRSRNGFRSFDPQTMHASMVRVEPSVSISARRRDDDLRAVDLVFDRHLHQLRQCLAHPRLLL